MITVLKPFLLIFLVSSALAICLSKRLISAVIIFACYSIVLSVLWILLAAPDIAITEAAVGTGVSGVIFFVALKRLSVTDMEFKWANAVSSTAKQKEKTDKGRRGFRYLYHSVFIAVSAGLTGILAYTASAFPPFGDPGNPANNEIPRKFLEEGVMDTGALNAVSAMLWSYRSFDTFGEACVLFAAACVILVLLRGGGVSLEANDPFRKEMDEPRQDPIIKTIAFLLVATIMIFGVYALLHGHITPGGGFSGGAIIGAAMVLYASAYGTRLANKFMNHKIFCRAISISLISYALAKGHKFFTGANSIDTAAPLGTPGNILSAGIILPLNIAVGIIVACTMYIIYILFSGGELQ